MTTTKYTEAKFTRIQISRIVVNYLLASGATPLQQRLMIFKMKRDKIRARFRTFKQHPRNLTNFEKGEKPQKIIQNEHIL